LTESSSSSSNPEEPFYASSPLERELLYQGEILLETPIFSMPMPSRWLLLRTASGKRIDEALNYGAGAKENRVRVLDSNQFDLEWQESKLGDFVMGILNKCPALVLSQNCDIANRDFIQIAPIIPIDAADAGLIERLQKHEVIDSFYLEPHPPEWEADAYADFELIQSVHKSYVKGIATENHFRLSDGKVLLLQQYLTRFFGRPNAYDVKGDAVPRDGIYMCAQCFYRDGTATSITFKKDGLFVVCQLCGGTKWLPRIVGSQR
jgi:hypothetical protein